MKMRTLLLMRGCPGSGKSTWIKENGLEKYTLEADQFRMLISNPEFDVDGKEHISQKNDKIAWAMLFQCLEERMKRGEFTVIDATHNNPNRIKEYISLCEQYKYNIYYYQIDISLEECKKRNLMRPEHKRVSDKVIERMHSMISQVPLQSRCKRIYDINEINNFYTFDANYFNEIRIYGDIHGCYDVLQTQKDFIDHPRILNIFLGDYLDRGDKNFETLSYLLEISKQENVIFLEGNHEIHLKNWANDEPIHSKEFANVTKVELEDKLNSCNLKFKEKFKKECRIFYKSLRQCFKFEFKGQTYLCTHGGLTSVPNLLFVSTQQLIKGFGDYETEVGEIFEENRVYRLCQNLIQFHGHRNCKSTQHSYCLEDSVEFGNNFKIAKLTRDSIYPEVIEVKNEWYVPKEVEQNENSTLNEEKQFYFENKELNKLINSNHVKVKKNPHNLYSINFKEKVFHKKIWNDITIKARGLFVDRDTGEIKLRSYNKFFNYGEIPQITGKRTLQDNLKFPVKCYLKENGFLGIMSVINDELVLATKSTCDNTEFTKMFKEIWNKVNPNYQNKMKNFLKEHNISATFEVIHQNDPHIIDYGNNVNKLVLLDFIDNSFEFKKRDDLLLKFLKLVKDKFDEYIKAKELIKLANSWEEIEELMNEVDSKEIEGIVFEDEVGFMFKYKGKYYQEWKRIRHLVHVYSKRPKDRFPYQMCISNLEISFMKWLTDRTWEENIDKSLIQLRKEFLERN